MMLRFGMKHNLTRKRFERHNRQRILLVLLLSVLTVIMTLPLAARAQQREQKTVRVGWFESPFCYRDQFGRRCGMDYEYQQKISAYTGWNYEYVEDSWPNLMNMLKDGEIDMLSDVSYTDERAEYLSYPVLPMGSESYYIYIDSNNREIDAGNLATFSGKRIGVNKGSVQEGFLKEWAEKNNISIEIVSLVTVEGESMGKLSRGEIDGYASINTFGAKEKVLPVCRIGTSDYYYAVNKNRTDLLAELNMALSGIQEEDPFFNDKMAAEHLYTTKTSAFLTPNQEKWLEEHGTVRIGYRDNYLPFCQADKETGELNGALKDYLAHASNSLKNSDVRFEAVPYPTTDAALEAMKAGEVDCVFPVCMNSYEAVEKDVRLTNPAMKTEMNAVMRVSDYYDISLDDKVTFAVSDGNPNIETFIKAQYPESGRKTFADEEECYKAVSSEEADCVLVSNYRIPAAEDTLQKYKLFSVPTGETMSLSFAVNRADRELFFLLNKTVATARRDETDSALVAYMYSDQKVSFARFMRDNWTSVMISILVIFAVIVVLLGQKLRAERRANEQQRLLEEAAEIAKLKQTITSLLDNMPGITFAKDAQTGVYLACNQAFVAYARKKRPEDVVGHTAEQIFDATMAQRFREDDAMALSMDEPYIFFEDVPDASGNQRQIKSTKLKYTDADGRLCVLGVSVDVTSDTIRIHREDVTTKEAYEKARGAGVIYSHIAQALARGYIDLYYIDLNTEEYIEYRTDADGGSLTEARRGWHFFEVCQEEIEQLVYPEDQDAVKKALDRKTLVAELDRNNTFLMTYRLKDEHGPGYVSMRVTRFKDDERSIILGVTDVDEQMKQRNWAARMKEEQVAYSRLSALAGDFLCVYVVVPETGRYREFSATKGFENFARLKEGMDFFADSREQGRRVIYPEDQNRFLSVLTRENVMKEIESHGIFTLSYRLMLDGVPSYVQLKAVMIEEEEGARLIIGINDIDTQIRQEEEYVRHLAKARMEANIDALTGVKNRHAYLLAEERLNGQIEDNNAPEFAIVLLDVNDLKKVNDTEGHKAGDRYLRDACKIICDTFKHSPVFRVGGDEFTVIAQGGDYACIEELVGQMGDHNSKAVRDGGIVIACGMARYEMDQKVASVFERADQYMYENKSDLKRRKMPS